MKIPATQETLGPPPRSERAVKKKAKGKGVPLALQREIHPVVRVVLYAVLFAFAVLTIYPLLWVIINSFKSTQAFQLNRMGLPNPWYFGNFPYVWEFGNFGTLFYNSAFYTTIATAAIILGSLSAGFAFAKLPSRLTKLLYGSFIVGILLTIQSIMVPLFLMINSAGLYNTRLGVLIPYIGFGLPIGVYLCTEFIRGIPSSLIESARIDGASYLRVFASIIVPMAKPVVATLSILTIHSVWNEFMLINILVSSNSLKSLPVGILMFSGALSTDYGRQFAGIVIGMVPMIIVYLIFRKQITKGIAAGAIKG